MNLFVNSVKIGLTDHINALPGNNYSACKYWNNWMLRRNIDSDYFRKNSAAHLDYNSMSTILKDIEKHDLVLTLHPVIS